MPLCWKESVSCAQSTQTGYWQRFADKLRETGALCPAWGKRDVPRRKLPQMHELMWNTYRESWNRETDESLLLLTFERKDLT